MFMFKDTMVEYGALRVHKYLIKEHLCPKCNHSHLLYTECCPKCGSSNLQIQNIIHHFSCANVSPESTYNVGGMLVCPKCHKKLRTSEWTMTALPSVLLLQRLREFIHITLTKATCTYCEGTFPVNALVPRDVVNYEITDEGIRVLTESSMMFNNMTNIYDNFMEYPLLVNRLRRQLMETYRKDALTVLVGKIWILNGEQETVKIKDSLQGILCRQFPSHRVAYNNNIFYISCTVFNDVSVEETQHQLSKDMSKAIRKLANKIEPDELVCCVVSTKTKR